LLAGIAPQAEMTASKLAGGKRRQAAALQSHIMNYGVVAGARSILNFENFASQ